LKAKNNNTAAGNSGMQNILYHTVIAKKKGPHTLGTLPRAVPETFAEACSL
jgi:hypothetical protein